MVVICVGLCYNVRGKIISIMGKSRVNAENRIDFIGHGMFNHFTTREHYVDYHLKNGIM